MTTNPYAPPAAAVSDPARSDVAPPIWNPTVAANWSLVFTPAFGSFVQMLNWEALGEPEKATGAKQWFIASVVVLIASAATALLLEDTGKVDVATRLAGFVYLFIWYFASGRAQARYVRERFGKSYPRKRWGEASDHCRDRTGCVRPVGGYCRVSHRKVRRRAG